MKQNEQKNSKRRLNSLILLVAFTAIMLIVSTYAWFSTQRNVTLTGLKGKVNVAEGLQVSLDGTHFVNSINFDDFDQTSDPTAWTVKNTATTTYLDAGKTFQAPAEGITNVVPSEYLPVSTTGGTDEGIGSTGLKMYNGTFTNSEGLKNIAIAPETSASGYYAFDLYLLNTSKSTVTSDKLQLDAISNITGTNANFGIQNTARIAFALYENSGEEMSTNKTLSGEQIIAGTSTGKNISDVAIWEPHSTKHVNNIVKNTSIIFGSTDKGKYNVTEDDLKTTQEDGRKRYAIKDNQSLPTYALTSASATALTIKDVYDWDITSEQGTAKSLKLQNTTQTDETDRDASIDLKSTKDGSTPIQIIANQYQKMRVYVWIEGQDPDCVNYASMGGGLTLDIGLSKPENDGTHTEDGP